MTKRILVTENEKNRILGLHRKAISREFLNEQGETTTPPLTQNTDTQVLSGGTQPQPTNPQTTQVDVNKLVEQLLEIMKQQAMMIQNQQEKQQVQQFIGQLPNTENMQEIRDNIQNFQFHEPEEIAQFATNFIGELKQMSKEQGEGQAPGQKGEDIAAELLRKGGEGIGKVIRGVAEKTAQGIKKGAPLIGKAIKGGAKLAGKAIGGFVKGAKNLIGGIAHGVTTSAATSSKTGGGSVGKTASSGGGTGGRSVR